MSEVQKFSLSPSIAIIAAGVIIAGAILYVNLNPAPAVAEQGATALPGSVDVPAPKVDDHWFGSHSAPVVLIEYSDFECPYCSLVFPTMKRLVEESNGEVAWVLRNFPLESIHAQARPAALAAECIAEERGDDAFWRYAEAIFANQGKMGAAYYRELALGVGADIARFDSCVASGRFNDRVDAEIGDAVSNGGQGTPYTVVWSKNYQAPLSGALPYEQFKAVISSVKNRQ